jgi:hypothetical protein
MQPLGENKLSLCVVLFRIFKDFNLYCPNQSSLKLLRPTEVRILHVVAYS